MTLTEQEALELTKQVETEGDPLAKYADRLTRQIADSEKQHGEEISRLRRGICALEAMVGVKMEEAVEGMEEVIKLMGVQIDGGNPESYDVPDHLPYIIRIRLLKMKLRITTQPT